MTTYTLFTTCPRGLEPILAQELQQQGCTDIAPTDGGVSCKGTLAHVYRMNLHSRTASRVLLQLTRATYRGEDDIYKAAKNLKWQDWFSVNQTFRVKVEGKRANVKSLDFIALKIKDGVCDRFRDHCDERPSIDKTRPNVRIHAFLDDRNVSIFIDTSGEALFKRGYRQDTGEAPLRENLAAGLLLLAGYDGSQPFQDPFCGSGTIAIEAALIALNRAAGLNRRFGFENLANFDKALWIKLKAEARSQIKDKPLAKISASDNDRFMTRAAKENAQAAEVDMFIEINTLDVQDTRPNGENGVVVSNPPYGVRLAEVQALHALYPQLGSWLKQHYAGWTAGMFTGDMEMPKLMRLKPKRKIPLYNGNLDCRLFLFDMVAGSNRDKSA
ncbi:class I SAM-dependent RNA methyltransferase [Kingella kingae]|uniref:THUMP domain-containing class I SAM-dependent RNA methyltransferase n=2 Tax=Kingella kingae TaxID=504 RepID=UPI00025845DC|nr:class I SAM-dependent RNA methyltransferase [Kingella kingae]EIC13738.1 putative N6-adenine-specific DNA methylase [Kingella kingae PYKK081]MBD3613011.1 class I SAM-dependent RNA methyltransferase [Kingella kingae]MBD3631369.1 class I SAM-dependent RNA methyltransferase [Kingella kingae]MBD3658677.1 class I SAM-dependent RNA methyltransferase [Kingella kingae]MDK4568643.1 class I SAM-dependent RNA methyltransferase [Kingella kingae]